ncbi:major facilitator superfamily domain-containing protein, partial [Apiospora arundinis]
PNSQPPRTRRKSSRWRSFYLLYYLALVYVISFYVNLPAGGLAALAILLLHIPEEEVKPKASTLLPRLHHHLDLIGFVLFAPAVLMLLLAL